MCATSLLQASWTRQCSRDESGLRRPLQTCAATLTVAAKMACAVVGDSGVVALLLVGPFRTLPACASSTRFDTCMECRQGACPDEEGCMQVPQDLVLLLLLLRHTDDCTHILNQPGRLPVAARITNTAPNRNA